MTASLVRPLDMQHRLFGELSSLFGREVPLYDRSLLVNRVCNRSVCDLLARLYSGFSISDEQLERTSGERHGAIRIGRPDEYRWVTRFFAAFAMEPHNYYDMSDVGAKSQPVVATAFRSVLDPEHRVFCSLLLTEYFDEETRTRIEALLASRQIFSDRAKALIEQSEREGGLEEEDAEALIAEAVERIFRWTGRARDYRLYTDLCAAGFKIAADIACFEAHHLNHLTPNTLCMDLYTAAMKRCMGELDRAGLTLRAERAVDRLVADVDPHWIRLHFRHLTMDAIDRYERRALPETLITETCAQLASRLEGDDLDLSSFAHNGFKDHTEGPSSDTPVLLRQDAYRALNEAVRFQEMDGSMIDAVHTARFGEIEQRFFAVTPDGRALYDESLARAEAEKERDPGLLSRDFDAFQRRYAEAFARFPKTLAELRAAGLVRVRYMATEAGLDAARRGEVGSADLERLLAVGFLRFEGLRYEDFLPVSAAGIFASNLNQYGTASTATVKPRVTREMFEEILGRSIIDSDVVYRGLEAQSLLDALSRLGVAQLIEPNRLDQLRRDAEALPSAARGPSDSSAS